jgi:spermidine dehydrogenase
MLGRTFEDIEREIREQLGNYLGAYDLDPARDIAGIGVSRWSHGVVVGPDYDPDYPEPHFERGRKPLGRVAVANSDSASQNSLQNATVDAFRAVQELLG